jgi:protein O-mannosyl-transferase
LTARARAAAFGLALFALAVVVHANALGARFTFDDFGLVVNNPAVPDGTSLSAVLTLPSATGGAYRPLTILSYRLDRLAGEGPAIAHAMNVVLHATTTVLVFALASRVLRTVAGGVVAAAIFAVHPVHTEAVTSVAGRAEVLAALFVLATLLASLAAERTGAAHPFRWRVASLAAFACALLAKENAAAAVGLVALLHRRRGGSRRVRHIAALLVPYVAMAGVFVLIRRQIVGGLTTGAPPPFLDNPLAYADAATRIRTALVVLAQYGSTLAVPLRLSADESFDQVPAATSVLDVRFVGALAALGGVTLVLAAWRRRAPALAFAGLFAAVAIALTANVAFPIGTIKAERLLYLPSVGWCLACGWLLRRWPRGGVQAAAGAALVLALGMRTWVRNWDWHDEFTLFTATAIASPNSARAQENAGAVYGQGGRLDEAIAHYRRALAIDPGSRSAALGLAVASELAGRPDDAARWRAHAATLPAARDDLVHALAR